MSMKPGAVHWSDMRAELPADVQGRLNEKRARRLAGEAMAELRRAAGVTQAEVAIGAAIPQSNVSRTEKGDDMLLSTIGRYMHAIGGSAELVLRNAEGTEIHIVLDAVSADLPKQSG
ncbi:helix-turn-helix transcriptional regulator [Devosia sp. MC521]|uniref:helix-turn-helix domain-containing protein n=1 Tax=Devosia sp. MC521 TaxID=2759954 RepID=UPI0020BE20AE|nr:helix-turn-helix transcriptional regulator [Devosia sp. MC521]